MSTAGSLRVAVTGATGLIGSQLLPRLRAAGHSVQRVVRRDPAPGDLCWDPERATIDAGALEGVDAVVHLAGANVGQRWTTAHKREIRESRVQGTRLLATALAALSRPPRVLVSMSAVGIYGSRGDELLDESSACGSDFLADVGRAWEGAADPARAAGIRVVHPRLGVVLTARGGALGRMLLPFRLGAGGRLGSGRQWMSWIALDDVLGALAHLLHAESLDGPVNVVAPNPVTNADFTAALGRAVRRPTVASVPAFALRLAFGEMADATLLASQRAVPARLQADGFAFAWPDVEGALRSTLP